MERLLDLSGFYPDEEREIEGNYSFPLPECFDVQGDVNTSFNGNVKFDGTAYVISADVQSEFFVECARCLKKIPNRLDFSVKEVYNKDDAEDRIDFFEIIVTSFISEKPLRHLCDESCKGLCPICGKDLNSSTCDCIKTNSPFSDEDIKLLKHTFK
ncbi:MAG: YceD family protein [Clostridiales bacterium]|jgi:uncharacterized protein|nr:YceD family protein [Clostridiales bacterium]